MPFRPTLLIRCLLGCALLSVTHVSVAQHALTESAQTYNEYQVGQSLDTIYSYGNCGCDLYQRIEELKCGCDINHRNALVALSGQGYAAAFNSRMALSTAMDERIFWQLRPGGPEPGRQIINYSDVGVLGGAGIGAGGYGAGGYGAGAYGAEGCGPGGDGLGASATGGACGIDGGTGTCNTGTCNTGTCNTALGRGPGAGYTSQSYLAATPPVTWIQGFGGSWETNQNAPVLDGRYGGVLFGGHLPITENFSAGLAAGYAKINSDDAGTNVDINTWRLLGYGRYADENFYAFGGGGYAFDRYTMNRAIAYDDVHRNAYGSARGNEVFGFGETGLMLPVSGNVLLQPFFGVSGGRFHRGNFTESGAQGLNLNVGSSAANAFLTRLGGRVALQQYLRPGWLVRPEFRAAWVHQYLRNPQAISASFVPEPSTGFFLLAAGPNRNAANLGTGVTLLLHDNYSLGAQYDAYIGDRATLQTIAGTAAVTW